MGRVRYMHISTNFSVRTLIIRFLGHFKMFEAILKILIFWGDASLLSRLPTSNNVPIPSIQPGELSVITTPRH